VAATSDEPDVTPERKRVQDDLRRRYQQITADLARYDGMRSFQNSGEFGAATLGQFGGATLSPENWLGLGAKGVNAAWRIVKAALQQGVISGAIDPLVQALNIKAGVQDEYDPTRTATAVAGGASLGAGTKAATEGLGHIGARWLLSPWEENRRMRYNQNHRELERFDPANPQLSPASVVPWVPQSRDINPLDQEIVALRAAQGLSFLENHHNFPREFQDYFRWFGIEPEEHKMFMTATEHRLKPDGLHTGPDDWNELWRRFIAKDPYPTDELAMRYLNQIMKEKMPWLKR
jgi:hypothetical protein